jgi:hypothetical protein
MSVNLDESLFGDDVPLEKFSKQDADAELQALKDDASDYSLVPYAKDNDSDQFSLVPYEKPTDFSEIAEEEDDDEDLLGEDAIRHFTSEMYEKYMTLSECVQEVILEDAHNIHTSEELDDWIEFSRDFCKEHKKKRSAKRRSASKKRSAKRSPKKVLSKAKRVKTDIEDIPMTGHRVVYKEKALKDARSLTKMTRRPLARKVRDDIVDIPMSGAPRKSPKRKALRDATKLVKSIKGGEVEALEGGELEGGELEGGKTKVNKQATKVKKDIKAIPTRGSASPKKRKAQQDAMELTQMTRRPLASTVRKDIDRIPARGKSKSRSPTKRKALRDATKLVKETGLRGGQTLAATLAGGQTSATLAGGQTATTLAGGQTAATLAGGQTAATLAGGQTAATLAGGDLEGGKTKVNKQATRVTRDIVAIPMTGRRSPKKEKAQRDATKLTQMTRRSLARKVRKDIDDIPMSGSPRKSPKRKALRDSKRLVRETE